MINVFRGTVNRSEDKDSNSVTLTLDILKKLNFNYVIYGERSQSGAMGNAGGIILDVLEGNKITRYETNVFNDEETAVEALKQITLHEDIFDIYAGGMGNGVIVNKKADLEIDKNAKCFWFTDRSTKYRIKSSVTGVFNGVSARMKNNTKGYDAMHEAWEQSLRDKFGKK